MGRAGSDGGGGGFHSSEGHSSERSSGGHHVGGGRAGSGRGYSNDGNHYNSYHGGGYRYHRSFHSGGGFSPASAIATVVIFLIILGLTFIQSFANAPKSSYAREKLNSGITYNNNCIVDEIGWFNNVSKTEKELKYFYDKTGVQPYIILHEYDETLKSDSDKEKWANDYYTSNLSAENVFLFVYFAERNTDTDVGYMCYVNGKQVSSVMDAEAVNIFWNYIDKNWYTDKSTDNVFISSFKSTAKTIMTKSKTVTDLAIYAVIGVVLICAFVFGFKALEAKHKRDKEEAEETERILNTPMQDLSNSSEADDIVDKYN